MGLSTKNISGRRNQVAELKKKHESLFESKGIENAKFIPKMAYIPTGGTDRIIAFFPSEIQGGEDIYTEFVSNVNVPEDPERTLWKWPFNPEYDTEYQKSEPHPATGHVRYLVPVDELMSVADPAPKKVIPKKQPTKAEPKQPELNFIDPVADLEAQTDAPINQMTIKDKAAIEWKLPVSDKPWLNELITKQFTYKS